MTRIVLIHAYAPSIEPIVSEFRKSWPEAQVLNLLDEALYADVSKDGALPSGMDKRVASLLRHAEASGAQGIVFTGATFGPAVEEARARIGVPVLKADEALCAEAVARGGKILVVSTARRALPVICANIRAAAAPNAPPDCVSLCVEEAKTALERGDVDSHDAALAEALRDISGYETILLGQISMAPVRRRLPPAVAACTLTSPEATVRRLMAMFGRKTEGGDATPPRQSKGR